MITALATLTLIFLVATFIFGIPKTRRIPMNAEDIMDRLNKLDKDLDAVEKKLD